MPKKKTLEESMREKFYKEVMTHRADKKEVVDTKLTLKLKKKLRREMHNARKQQ